MEKLLLDKYEVFCNNRIRLEIEYMKLAAAAFFALGTAASAADVGILEVGILTLYPRTQFCTVEGSFIPAGATIIFARLAPNLGTFQVKRIGPTTGSYGPGFCFELPLDPGKLEPGTHLLFVDVSLTKKDRFGNVFSLRGGTGINIHAEGTRIFPPYITSAVQQETDRLKILITGRFNPDRPHQVFLSEAFKKVKPEAVTVFADRIEIDLGKDPENATWATGDMPIVVHDPRHGGDGRSDSFLLRWRNPLD